jgi:hypothetical protein
VYRLSVTASGGIGEVTDLGSFSLAAQMRNDIALSPDAGMLAVPLFFGVKQLFSAATEVGLAVINLATRQIRTWSTRDAGGYWPGTPTWGATDATVTFPWLHTTSARTDSYALTGLRQLDVNAPGANLLSSRLVSFPAAVPASSGLPAFGNARSTIITADGRRIIGESCHATTQVRSRSGSVTAQIVDMSATTGRVVSVLRTRTVRYANEREESTLFNECTFGLSAADPSGQHLLVHAFGFGRIDNGVFTALPATPPSVLPWPYAADW